MVLDFFFFDLQRQNGEDRAEISGPHLKCVYLFNLCFRLKFPLHVTLVSHCVQLQHPKISESTTDPWLHLDYAASFTLAHTAFHF